MREPCIYFRSELGLCCIAWSEKGIRSFRLLGEQALPRDEAKNAPLWVLEAVARITRHLDGDPQDLKGIPLDFHGITPFQGRVFEVLQKLKPGQTLSYGETALLAGSPGAARAVGQAVARNPLLLLIPCHRVLAAAGRPGGFSAFGSLETKARLLALEGVKLPHT